MSIHACPDGASGIPALAPVNGNGCLDLFAIRLADLRSKIRTEPVSALLRFCTCARILGAALHFVHGYADVVPRRVSLQARVVLSYEVQPRAGSWFRGPDLLCPCIRLAGGARGLGAHLRSRVNSCLRLRWDVVVHEWCTSRRKTGVSERKTSVARLR